MAQTVSHENQRQKSYSRKTSQFFPFSDLAGQGKKFFLNNF